MCSSSFDPAWVTSVGWSYSNLDALRRSWCKDVTGVEGDERLYQYIAFAGFLARQGHLCKLQSHDY